MPVDSVPIFDSVVQRIDPYIKHPLVSADKYIETVYGNVQEHVVAAKVKVFSLRTLASKRVHSLLSATLAKGVVLVENSEALVDKLLPANDDNEVSFTNGQVTHMGMASRAVALPYRISLRTSRVFMLKAGDTSQWAMRFTSAHRALIGQSSGQLFAKFVSVSEPGVTAIVSGKDTAAKKLHIIWQSLVNSEHAVVVCIQGQCYFVSGRLKFPELRVWTMDRVENLQQRCGKVARAAKRSAFAATQAVGGERAVLLVAKVGAYAPSLLAEAEHEAEFCMGELANECLPVARKMVIHWIKDHKDTRAWLHKNGLEEKDVNDILKMIDSVHELQTLVNNPGEFFTKLEGECFPVMRRIAAAQLKNNVHANTFLRENGLQQEDLMQIVDEVDTPQELQDAIKNPEAFFERLGLNCLPIAKKIALAQFRQNKEVESFLRENGLQQEDLMHMVDEVDTPQDLQDAMTNPEVFVARLANDCPPIAKKIALAQFRQSREVQSFLWENSLQTEDLAHILDDVDSPQELQEGINNPEAFCAQCLPIAKKVAMARMLRDPFTKDFLTENGIGEQDLLQAFGEIGTIQELQACAEHPEMSLKRMLTQFAPVAKQMTVAQLRKSEQIQTFLCKNGLDDSDLVHIFEPLSVTQLESLLQDPQAFVSREFAEYLPVAKKVAAIQLQKQEQMQAWLNENGLQPEDLLMCLEAVTSAQELEAGIRDPVDFLSQLSSKCLPVARKMAVARLQTDRKMQKSLREHGLDNEDLMQLLEVVTSTDSLQECLKNPDSFLAHLGKH